MTDEEIEEAENLKLKLKYNYRRVYVRLRDISHPAEIPGKKSHCKIIFFDWSEMIVKGSYDDICNKLDDREALHEEQMIEQAMKEVDDDLPE